MIDVCDCLYDDNKSKEDLLNHVKIQKTTYKDAYQIISILNKCFGIKSKEEALRQLLYSDADLDNSVKLVDERDNKIYGILIFCKFPIDKGSPIMDFNKVLGTHLMKFNQINGHSFIIDERLRGTSIHKKMLMFNYEYLKQFDIIWCAVEKDLKSHSYWKHLGFEEILSIDEAKFYIKPSSKELMLEIFIIKLLSERNEKNYNN